MRVWLGTLCLLMIVALVGCGGGGGDTPVVDPVATASAAGRWSGTLTTHWSDGDATDAFALELTQSGSSVTGTFTIGTESPVNVTGTVSGSGFTFSGVLACAGNNTVQFGGTISGSTLTITSASGTACNGATLLGATSTLLLAPPVATFAPSDLVGTWTIIYDVGTPSVHTEVIIIVTNEVPPAGTLYGLAADGVFSFTDQGGFVHAAQMSSDKSSLLSGTYLGSQGSGVWTATKSLLNTPLSNATLNGTYISSLYSDISGATVTKLKEITFDGAGGFSFVDLARSDTRSATGSGTYSVASDGTVTTNIGVVGIVSSDGNIFSLSDTDASDSQIEFALGLKKGASLSNASLNGGYSVSKLMDDGWGVGSLLDMSFDGAGNVTGTTILSSDGHLGTGTSTYSVATDGAITLDLDPMGFVSADGKMFITADTNPNLDNALSIFAGMKKGTGLSNATLNGAYVFNAFRDVQANVSNSRSYVATRSVLTFDGAGNGTYATLASSDGSNNTGAFTYSIASDGKITFGSGDLRVGYVNSAGNTVFMIDPDSNDNNVGIFVGLKKSL